MQNGSALNSDTDQRTPESIAAALDAIPDDVTQTQPIDAGELPQPQPLVMMEPWALVDVSWVVPFADMLIKLPYEQAARATGDDCWLVTDDQIELINPALENALRWVTWRIGAAGAVGHPLTALAVAVGTLTAAKFGVYKFHEHQRSEGGPVAARTNPRPQPQQQTPGPRPMPQPVTSPTTAMDTSITNGRMEESGGASSFVASRAAGKAISSKKEFVVAGE